MLRSPRTWRSHYIQSSSQYGYPASCCAKLVVHHKSSPCFYVFDPRATESLLDAAFSLNPLRISQNRTMTVRSPFSVFWHLLTDRSTRLAPSVRKCIEFIASCQRLSCLPPATVLPYLISRLFLKSREVLTRKSMW